MADVCVGVGSNVDPETHVPAALRRMAARWRVLAVSEVWRTAPAGTARGGDFWNLAVRLEIDAPPESVRRELRRLEEAAGRRREDDRSAPRTLDLDLLLYDDRIEPGPDLVLPHPQIATEPFVLVPLAEIDPDRVHPTEGTTLGALRARLPTRPPGMVPLSDWTATLRRIVAESKGAGPRGPR